MLTACVAGRVSNQIRLSDEELGGTPPGPPTDDTVFPSTFQVNYIRVWQEAP